LANVYFEDELTRQRMMNRLLRDERLAASRPISPSCRIFWAKRPTKAEKRRRSAHFPNHHQGDNERDQDDAEVLDSVDGHQTALPFSPTAFGALATHS
jgi:hypothetical protein